MTTQLPFDLETEQAALKRKQGLVDAFGTQLLKPKQGQMIGNRYVGTSPLDAIATVLSAFMMNKGQEGLDGEARELKNKYNEKLQSGVESYLTTRSGSPAQGVMNDAQAAQLMEGGVDPTANTPMESIQPATPANPRAAAVQALTSGLAPLQQLGMSDLTQLGKASMTPKDFLSLSGYDPRSKLVAALSGDMTGLTPEMKEHVVNGQVVAGRPELGYRPAGDFRDRFSGVGELAPGVRGQLNTGTGEAKFAPTGTNVNIDTAEKAGVQFSKELAGKRAEVIAKSYDNAVAASKALEALNNARADFDAGVKSGIAGSVSLGLAKVGKALGMEADPQIANTEAFRANMARETLNLVKSLGAGTGISNADREFAEKASGGSILLDDKAMVRLMNVAQAAAGNVLVGHDQLLGRNADATGALPQDLNTFKLDWQVPENDAVKFDERVRRFEVAAPPSSTPAGAGRLPSKATPKTVRWEDL